MHRINSPDSIPGLIPNVLLITSSAHAKAIFSVDSPLHHSLTFTPPISQILSISDCLLSS